MFWVELLFECVDGCNEDDEILLVIGSWVFVVDEIVVFCWLIEILFVGWWFDVMGVEIIEDVFDIFEVVESVGLFIDILVFSSMLEWWGV